MFYIQTCSDALGQTPFPCHPPSLSSVLGARQRQFLSPWVGLFVRVRGSINTSLIVAMKNVSRCCQMSPGVDSRPQLRTPALDNVE